MKTLQRILIILGLGALVALVTWAAVTVISVASLPTDTMDYTASIPPDISSAVPGIMGIIKPLVLITLVVVIEQTIENAINKKKRRAQIANP